MFTGIIEEMGIVLAVGPGEITVGAEAVMSDLVLGQSIAIDGVDLTVAALTERSFHANVMAETYRRSTLGTQKPGRRVNLERAVLPTTRLSGHIVRGVVEGTAQVEDVSSEADALVLRFSTTPELLRRLVVKGPVAVDGASFTVIARDETSFSVSIVLYSQDHTTITDRRDGDLVNVETDILSRYVDAAVARQTRGGERR
jgi:riboflavin synthase